MNQELEAERIARIPESGLRLTVFRSFVEAQPAWLAFETAADCYAFQTYAWLKNWHDCVGKDAGVEPCIALLETAEAEPLMLLPLGIERRGGASCLVWLGGVISDYHAPLLAKDGARIIDADRFAAAWDVIRSALPRHDAVVLEKQPEFIGPQPNPMLGLPCALNPSGAHSMGLHGPFDDFIRAKRSSNWLGSERRKERRLMEYGSLEYRVAFGHREIRRFSAEMMTQKSQSYREMGVRDLFDEPGHRRFIERLSEQYVPEGFVHLSALTLDDRVLATLWGLVHNRRFYHLFPTYARGELSRYSPGNSLLRRVFEWCIANGVQVYDFTIGDEAYKYDWRDRELRLFDCIYATTARGWRYAAPARLARWAKRRIKRSPLLWGLARSLRSTMAGYRRS